MLGSTEQVGKLTVTFTYKDTVPIRCCFAQNVSFDPVLRIRICKIHMFLGLPDPDRLVQGTDPYPNPDPVPSIVKQKQKTLNPVL